VTERLVCFTEQFFDRLDLLLPNERGADGTPSVTDFLLLDLPRVRDALVSDYEGSTLPTEEPDVRVLIAAGVLVDRYAIYATCEDNTVDVFWLVFDEAGERRR